MKIIGASQEKEFAGNKRMKIAEFYIFLLETYQAIRVVFKPKKKTLFQFDLFRI